MDPGGSIPLEAYNTIEDGPNMLAVDTGGYPIRHTNNFTDALTELPHSFHFALEKEFADLGHLLHALIDEGKQVAKSLGIVLHEDPWEMNKIGAQTDHPPSMLYDVRHKLRTEVDFLGGAIAREAQRVGIPAPLHTALYRLIKGKEAAWSYEGKKHAAVQRQT